MTSSALEIFQAYHNSLGSGSNLWKNLFAEDVIFRGPIDKVLGREANIKLAEGFFPIVRGVRHKQTITQGNMVATQAEFRVAAPSGNEMLLEMAEFYEIEDGLIKSIQVYYDAEEFRKEFGIRHSIEKVEA